MRIKECSRQAVILLFSLHHLYTERLFLFTFLHDSVTVTYTVWYGTNAGLKLPIIMCIWLGCRLTSNNEQKLCLRKRTPCTHSKHSTTGAGLTASQYHERAYEWMYKEWATPPHELWPSAIYCVSPSVLSPLPQQSHNSNEVQYLTLRGIWVFTWFH
jgi:hypothetical protein